MFQLVQAVKSFWRNTHRHGASASAQGEASVPAGFRAEPPPAVVRELEALVRGPTAVPDAVAPLELALRRFILRDLMSEEPSQKPDWPMAPSLVRGKKIRHEPRVRCSLSL